MLAQDVVDRYDLRRTLMARAVAEQPALSLYLIFGDMELEELDLDPKAGSDAPLASLARQEADVHGLVVAGDVLVHRAVHHFKARTGLSLYVLGNLRARNILVSGMELVVRGSLTVDEVFCGTGGTGGARLDGGVSGKLLVSDGFPMLIGGRLTAPVLATGSTRIGIVESGSVREVKGDVPPAVVLNPGVLGTDPVTGEPALALDRLWAAMSARQPVLTPDYLAGRTDLETVRQVRWLDTEIEKALAAGNYSMSIDLLRAARERGSARVYNGLRMADAIYRTHFGTGDRVMLTEALQVLDESLGAEPGPDLVVAHPQALLQRASILHVLHEDDDWAFEQAWRDCSLAVVALPAQERAGIAGLMGQWLFSRRRYADAVPYLEQALANDPNDGVMHGRIARALWMLDRESEALPYASSSLQLNPVDDRMWFVRGTCRRALGQLAEARLDLQTYLELHPDDVAAVEALVEITLGQGQPELAIDRAQRFVLDFPEITDASARFGRLFRQQGMHDRAVPFLRRAVELEPTDRTGVRDLAVALVDAGIGQAGLTTALRSLEIDPDGDHVAYVRAECFLALGDEETAAGDLETYLAGFPDAARAQASLALIRLGQGRTEEAEKLLGLAWSLAPDDYFVEEIAGRIGVEPPERPRTGRRASHVSRT